MIGPLRFLARFLRRALGRFSDALLLATLLAASGLCPGLLTGINGHLFAYAVGMLIISLVADLALMVSKPDTPPCGTDQPELDFKDEDK
jgi:hypothetical protein